MKKISFLILIIAIAFSACAKPPEEEMNNAIAAVSRAENDPDVSSYAANTLARARDALANMQTEADAKRYDAARTLATEAQQLAEKAISDSKTAASRTANEASTELEALKTALVDTDKTIKDARRAKQNADYAKIDTDYNSAKTLADDAQRDNDNKKYRDSLEKSRIARSTLSSITSTLSQRVIAESRKK